jgi:hypothetical protein
MVAALEDDELVQEAPAIVGCQTSSALAHWHEQASVARRVLGPGR